MPAAETGAAAGRREIGALLFLTAAMTTFDAYSTLNSSPWTAESFGADPARAASLRKYVIHAVVFSMAYATISSVMAGTAIPFVGAALGNAYLGWLYAAAVKIGRQRGQASWADGTGSS